MFTLSLHDEFGIFHKIGSVKIGFKGQTTAVDTFEKLPETFDSIGPDFFSLGQGVDFYRNLAALSSSTRNLLLQSLHDLVANPALIDAIKEEEVFKTSFLRNVSLTVIKGQYSRIIEGKAELTDFQFKFIRPATEDIGSIEIDFDVRVDSTPSTNIHAVIGRNGVGKTTLLNGMIEAITGSSNSKFIDTSSFSESEISSDYFSSLVSVSFSAFDPFNPPKEQSDPAKGTRYFYIGLKDPRSGPLHRTIDDLRHDCAKSLINCFLDQRKTERWLSAITKLGSDENFSYMKLERLESHYRETRNLSSSEVQSDSEDFIHKYKKKIIPFLERMSSGHAIVLLTITRLVETVEEKTLVLLDEPESHLHPPLLSAFIRALSDLLNDQNGVAIIATHSPVVLQEIPKSCAWKIFRTGTDVAISRPVIETFGENVGILTSEVFSLEVRRSGFHALLAKSVNSGRIYEQIIADYKNQLGIEGRAILKALIANRDRGTKDGAS
jgi:predicted ATPase